jgi:WD40 repeat protein
LSPSPPETPEPPRLAIKVKQPQKTKNAANAMVIAIKKPNVEKEDKKPAEVVVLQGEVPASAATVEEPSMKPITPKPETPKPPTPQEVAKSEPKPEPVRLVTGSDDYTLILWEPDNNDKPIARLTGHQGVVNQVSFSPDGRMIASASFDKSIKIWDAKTGKFMMTLRGHVGPVYQVSWSGDSRLVVSASKDSTAKVWSVETGRLICDLPGHFDEVFAVDWSPDGQRVGSGGKDRVLKIWRQ